MFSLERLALSHNGFEDCSFWSSCSTSWAQRAAGCISQGIWKNARCRGCVKVVSYEWTARSVGIEFSFLLTQMCFAPQRRALFRHLNFSKCSEAEVFCTFSLGNVLRATTACIFFISHLASWLRTRRFSEVTFRPSGATNHWKNIVNRDFPTFSRTCIFLLLTLSLLFSSHFLTSPSWLFPPLLFHLSILSEVWLLNFLRWIFLCTCMCICFCRWVCICLCLCICAYVYVYVNANVNVFFFKLMYIYTYR